MAVHTWALTIKASALGRSFFGCSSKEGTRALAPPAASTRSTPTANKEFQLDGGYSLIQHRRESLNFQDPLGNVVCSLDMNSTEQTS